MLKHSMSNCILIEEPEISLHPFLQRQMARTLVKIANTGCPVIISTHSDIIIQHINNMIRLGSRPDKDAVLLNLEEKYDKDDIIDNEKVSIYQFAIHDGATEIEPLLLFVSKTLKECPLIG